MGIKEIVNFFSQRVPEKMDGERYKKLGDRQPIQRNVPEKG